MLLNRIDKYRKVVPPGLGGYFYRSGNCSIQTFLPPWCQKQSFCRGFETFSRGIGRRFFYDKKFKMPAALIILFQIVFEKAFDFVKRDFIGLVIQIHMVGPFDNHQLFVIAF